MSSRFVSAGTDQAPASKQDGWEKARQEVESQRASKPVQSGKQDDGRSLYEVLQANKAAKQEAFEEASKLRNQFRPLDDSEVEFLDSVRQSERAREDTLKRETAEQLDTFRKNKVQAEQEAADLNRETATTGETVNDDLWVASRKRRRDQGEELVSSAKLAKSFRIENEKKRIVGADTVSKEKPISNMGSTTGLPSESQPRNEEKNEQPVSAGLALVTYDSDTDSD